MAITIHQQPATHSAIGSKTIIVASSTNSGNDGFQYDVEVASYVYDETQNFLIPPNPKGRLLFDPFAPLKTFLRNSASSEADENKSIHGQLTTSDINLQEYVVMSSVAGNINASVTIYESWLIDGIQTRNEESEVAVYYYVYNAQLTLQQGLNYDFLEMIGHQDGANSRIMSDRDGNTSTWDMAESFGLNSNAIFIQTYESDWGVWCVRQKSPSSDSEASKIRLSIMPNSGPPAQQVYDLAEHNFYSNLPIYPANLNGSSIPDILKPEDYPNWKAIYFQLLDDTDQIVSKSYVMYNAERDGNCERFDKIRIAWVGRRGGWEYWNFTMKSEESYVTDKVVAQRVIGNYGQAEDGLGTPFQIKKYDESEVVVDLKIQKFVTANSDWLSEGEFEYIKGLFLSKQVHWVQDDGSHIPVILEANGYEVKRQFTQGKLYNQQIKFKIAQEQFN